MLNAALLNTEREREKKETNKIIMYSSNTANENRRMNNENATHTDKNSFTLQCTLVFRFMYI